MTRRVHSSVPRTILLLLLLATFAVSVSGQSAKDTATDSQFHKFQPKVSPERAALATAGQSAGNDGLSSLTVQQIVALEQDKGSRTAAQKKIDSNVLYTVRMLAGKPAAPGVDYLETGAELDQNDNIVVDITAKVTTDLLQQLNWAGATVLYSSAPYRSIRAIVPPSQIETIAASPDVIFITPKIGSITAGSPQLPERHAFLGSLLPLPREMREARLRRRLAALLQTITPPPTGQGSVTTEGDLTHRAFDARGAFGVNGAGLKIGVLSDSADNTGAATAAQATGDLPPTCPGPGGPCLTIVQDRPGGGSDEGTAMMEIIYDMAPGASIFFATADISEASFATNIQNLRTVSHCDIIVDDVFYFDESPFQDGIVAQAVNSVVAAGALYFSSAGNEGNVDSNTAGYFEGDFNDTGSPAFTFPGGAKTGTIHNFGTVATPVNGDIINARGEVYTLNWADPAGASGNDYDLFLVSSTGTVKASSTNIQSGTQNPFEQINPPALAAGDRLVVFKTTGSASVAFSLNTVRGSLTVVTTGQTHGHSAAAPVGVFSVAATPAAAAFGPGSPSGPFPNPFTVSNKVELFTSDGPRRVFFNADGSAITPGNFTFAGNGGAVRNKPDITASDGVSTTLPLGSGLNPFFGTSAAAPSAAAVAALVKSAKPSLTQAQIQSALENTALDIMAAGNDRDSGHGIVMAWEAINSLGVTGFANPELGTIVAAENPGNGNGIIEAGEGAKLTIQLKNTSGVKDATAVTGTLTSSTPGIIITQPGTSTFADIAAGTAGGNNLTPFTFTLASNYPCGQAANFTLTVNYTGGPQRVFNFSVQTGLLTLSNSVGTQPPAFSGLTTATGNEVDRLNRNGVVSACGSPKAFPGAITTAPTNHRFDSYTFTACQSLCLSPVVNSAGVGLFTSLYSPSFDPNNIGTNYQGDAGLSSNTQTFGVSITAGTPYTIVVNEVTGNPPVPAATPYTVSFPACAFNCNVNHPPVAKAHNVTVAATTASGGGVANVDNGSFDPDGDPITLSQNPPSPYPNGNTNVILTVTDSKGAAAQANAVVTVVPSGFNISLAIPSIQIEAGQTATQEILFTPTPGTGAPVTFSCSPLPPGATCSFSPSSIPAGSPATTVVMSISTSTHASLQRPRMFYTSWMPVAGMGLIGMIVLAKPRRRRKASLLVALAMMSVLFLLVGCGTGGGGSKQFGPFTETVTATSGQVTRSANFTLTITGLK